jgi:ribokinase
MSKKKIVVFGSYVTDLMFRVPRLPVKGETLIASTFKMGPGGKGANQAVAAKRAGANVSMITKIGKDKFGELAIENFQKEGIDSKYIFLDEEYPTACATVLVDESTGDNQIAITYGATEHITPEEVETARKEIESAGILVTQLEANLDATEKAIDIARKNNAIIIMDPAPARPLTDDFLSKIDIITPNEIEASMLCDNLKVESVEEAKKAADILLSRGTRNVIITLGEKGALLANGDGEHYIEALQVDAIDTTGAGDAYNGGLATALAEGKSLLYAAKFANVVGGLCVTKMGTAPSMPFRKEINNIF